MSSMIIKHAPFNNLLEDFKQTHQLNITMSSMWLDFLQSTSSFTSKKSLLKTMNNQGIDQNQAFIFQFLEAIDLDQMSLLDKTKIQQRVQQSISPLSLAHYVSNPYYQIVRPQPMQVEDWAITYQTLQPFQGCVYDDVRIDPTTFIETTPIGYFHEPFTYLAIEQNNTTWMSVTPFEIHTMEPILKTLKGKVVALGLGLGYFAFMAALNPSVTHITVIEKDKTAIELFIKYIFPFFPHPTKITILHQDAFDYLSVVQNDVDFLFVDIYHSADDGLPLYLRIKKIEPLWKRTSFSYWLEQSMIGLIRRYQCISLSLDGKNSLKKYSPWAQTFLKSIDIIHQQITVESADHLHQWLSSENIHLMIQKLSSF